MRITRRAVLSRFVVGLGITLLMPGLAGATSYGETADRLRRLFGKSRSCLRLARRPDVRLGIREAASIENCIGLSAAQIARLSDGALLARIEKNIKQDFERGQVHLVDGWQVSSTELAIIKNL